MIVVLDKLTYAGRRENLQEVMEEITFVQGDICDRDAVHNAMEGCDAAVNFAAETHVDRSIDKRMPFLPTNVLGTHTLLEAARKSDLEKIRADRNGRGLWKCRIRLLHRNRSP